jgi:dihydrolipoamide dehydrogenase
MDHIDVAVIGAGPGGYPAAIRAAQLGARVAIIEKEKFGGTCLNWGCIPTKTLIASSDLYHRMAHAKDLGLRTGKTSFNYKAMVARKNEVVNGLREGVTQLLKANKVQAIDGTASFDTRNRLRISGDGGDRLLAADNVIIATGATSAMPGFLPTSPRVLDSKAFLDLTELPTSLLVLGGGVIGCEFACMAAQLGAEVTIVEPGFLMPRMVMQLCEASSTTATPCDFRLFIMKSAIWYVSLS